MVVASPWSFLSDLVNVGKGRDCSGRLATCGGACDEGMVIGALIPILFLIYD